MESYTDRMFSKEELREIRERFFFVERDYRGRERLFFDNAGGSLRLKAAEEAFRRIDSLPDASEHSNAVAVELAELEDRARRDIKEVIFGAESGTVFPAYSASQIAMEVVRVLLENTEGTNVVTTTLEHPSVFDAASFYSRKNGLELRVAKVNPETGGVDAQEILSLVDEGTALLCCMAASNISGYIYETKRICEGARAIRPDIRIFVDAVQHAPHACLDPEGWGVDVMSFAPYKFFGVRGFGLAWLSDRVSALPHHRLLGKVPDEWEIGSPATAQYAAVTQIVDYVAELGRKALPGETDRRALFAGGMGRIADHERGLLQLLLEGVGTTTGLRHMEGVRVQMDGRDLRTRDLILGIEFDRLPCERAVREYEKRGVIAFERARTSMYSRRMVEAFGSEGMVRISPLHVHTPEEMERFLRITGEVAKA